MDKSNSPAAKGPTAAASAPVTISPLLGSPPPLFRRIDWLAFFLTALCVWIGYFYSLAPDLTLEDSGELAVASMYAGIPHPPGYPVWTIYTWLWATFLPMKNIAWRVALGEATAGALACGLLGFLVSRGSSMMIEGIAELKGIARRWENLICIVAGFVAGTLLGFNGYMWSQSIIVEVYSFSVLSLMGVLVCLLRWMYAPFQRRYLYWAFFLFGICFTNHQTLIVAAMGIEIAIAAADFRLGRSLFLWNSIAYLAGLILRAQKLMFMDTNPMVFTIFNVVGLCSIVAYVLFSIWTKLRVEEFVRDAVLVGGCLVFAATRNTIGGLVLIAGLALAYYLNRKNKLTWEWTVGLICGLLWIVGSSFYLYMALAGMSTPPMQWGYPRTVEGFMHALTRGQYEKTTPVDFFSDPLRFFTQLQMFAEGVVEEFNWVYALLAIVPFFFFSRMQKRERAWIIGITSIYLCLGVLLLILLNPPPDRAARELIRVFFTASHVMVAMGVGYGLTLVAATLAVHFEKARRGALLGGLVAFDLAIFALAISTHNLLGEARGAGDSAALFNFLRFVFVAVTGATAVLIGYRLFSRSDNEGEGEGYTLIGLGVIGVLCLLTCVQIFKSTEPSGIDQSTLAGFAKILCWLVAAVCFYFAAHPRPGEDKKLSLGVGALLSLISVVLTFVTLLGQKVQLSGLGEFFGALGKVFNPAQYAMPVIAALILVASVLIYLVATFINRQRAPLAVILFVFALMPLHSFLSHWADNEQRNHLFGYWFGHDMFTPPFPTKDGKLSYDPKLREEAMKDPERAKFVYPEMTRDAILYGGTDPGRFCPTYMIFCESFIPAECKPLDPLFDRRDVYIITQNALADGTYLNYIRSHYNRSAQKDMPFFQEVVRSSRERESNYTTNGLAMLALKFLDKPLTGLGERIEARRRKEGVYPMKEMYIATPDDSQRCFQEYLQDANRRLAHDNQFPNEPRQIKPGEDVKIIDNRVQVSGQVAVMSINGLLTKVMFDKNPTNEFFVEESFPLDWMYPHLTPFGVIMKINRQPIASLPEEVFQRDHDFWTRYSERLIGNWITYDTSVKEIADFVEKVYLKRDYSDFKGDRKFARDDNAQKAFSKLRSSIGGVYAWRIGPYCTPEYRPKSQAEVARIYKEADFTFRQAFAYCPYSPEAVFRYVNLLLQPPAGMPPRFDDALIVAQTCLKLDPYNGQVIDLVNRLKSYKDSAGEFEKMRGNLQKMEDDLRKNPSDYQAAFNLASTYMQMQQPDRAIAILDRMMNDPKVDVNVLRALLQAYMGVNNPQRVQLTIQKLEALATATPTNLRASVGAAEGYRMLQQTDRANQALDRVLADSHLEANVLVEVAQAYAQLGNLTKLETSLEKLLQFVPNEAEPYYDLAALKAGLGKPADAIKQLARAIEINTARRATNTGLKSLAESARTDDRFASLRTQPEFQKLTAK